MKSNILILCAFHDIKITLRKLQWVLHHFQNTLCLLRCALHDLENEIRKLSDSFRKTTPLFNLNEIWFWNSKLLG